MFLFIWNKLNATCSPPPLIFFPLLKRTALLLLLNNNKNNRNVCCWTEWRGGRSKNISRRGLKSAIFPQHCTRNCYSIISRNCGKISGWFSFSHFFFFLLYLLLPWIIQSVLSISILISLLLLRQMTNVLKYFSAFFSSFYSSSLVINQRHFCYFSFSDIHPLTCE